MNVYTVKESRKQLENVNLLNIVYKLTIWKICCSEYIGKYELIECPKAINGQFGSGLSQGPHPAATP